jgi:hypothetical protein
MWMVTQDRKRGKKTAVVGVNMIKIYYKDEENYQIETHYFKNHI